MTLETMRVIAVILVGGSLAALIWFVDRGNPNKNKPLDHSPEFDRIILNKMSVHPLPWSTSGNSGEVYDLNGNLVADCSGENGGADYLVERAKTLREKKLAGKLQL